MKRATIGPVLAVVVGAAGILAFAARSPQNDAPARASPARVNIAEHVSIADFDQFLAAANHSSDRDLAKKLARFELTERASSARLSQWQQRFNGKRTREVLTALADLSAFQSLPAAELPADPPPDPATQREIFARVVDYVVKTRPRLPNFSARRNTTRFELSTAADMSSEKQAEFLFGFQKGKINFQPLGRIRPGPGGGQWLYVAAMSSKLVTYRNGYEVTESQNTHNDTHNMLNLESRLSTEGEFGPILGVVADDAVHGKVTWGHWERDADQTLAVFQYSVQQSASHFALQKSPFEDESHPAYTGEIAVDPASGAIHRLTLLANVNDAQISETGIVVEYGPMEIGGKSYTCPIRSIAITRGPVQDRSGAAIPEALTPTYLNDVSFTDYHVFRAVTRILPDAGTP
jgi:hypothetical protein